MLGKDHGLGFNTEKVQSDLKDETQRVYIINI